MTSTAAVPGSSRQLVVHGGIEYPGEVITADRWSASLGQRLSGATYFRAVFLEEWTDEAPEGIEDTRIAVCIPGRGGPGRAWEEARRELRVLLEARAQYVAGQAEPAEALEREVEGRARELSTRLSHQRALLYAAGSIVAEPPLEDDPAEVFSGDTPSQWAQQLGERLLARA